MPGVRAAGDPWLPPSVSFTRLPPVWDGAGRGVGKDLARSHVSVWWRCVALSRLPCLSEWGSEDCEKNRVLLYGCMDTMLRNGEGGTRSWQSHLNGCSLLSCVCSPPHPCFYSLLSLSFRTNAPPPPPDLTPPPSSKDGCRAGELILLPEVNLSIIQRTSAQAPVPQPGRLGTGSSPGHLSARAGV